MGTRKAFETDRELHVARADDVLNLEVGELCVEAELLDDTRVLARRQLAVGLALRTRHDHLAGGEDERRGLGVADTHDDGGETLGVVLGVTGVQCDRLEVEATGKVHSGHQVLQLGRDAGRRSGTVLVRRGGGRRKRRGAGVPLRGRHRRLHSTVCILSRTVAVGICGVGGVVLVLRSDV